MCLSRFRRLAALFLSLVLAGSLALPAAAEDWLVPKTHEAPVFIDMAGVWCADAADTVCEAGLMQGTGQAFDPSGALLPEHAVVICARLYGLLTGGDGVLPAPAEGQAWYDPAYEYLAASIGYRGSRDPATGRYLGGGDGAQTPEEQQNALLANFTPGKYAVQRFQFLDLLDRTLTAAEADLPAINHITVLPDTGSPMVLKFYNAGILTGSDQYGTFQGGRELNRGQAAAILARLVDPGQRTAFTPVPFDLCADVLGLEADSQAIAIEYDGIAAELSADIAAPALCEQLERQYHRMLADGPDANDLDLALRDAVAALKEDVAVSRLAARMGVTATDEELEEACGPILPGCRGMTAAAQQWENTCALLYKKLLEVYEEEYGTEVVAPSPGAPSRGEEVLEGDLADMTEQMTALIAPEIQDLDLAAAQARLAALPAV